MAHEPTEEERAIMRQVLERNPHLLCVSQLEDGDLLILDFTKTSPGVITSEHFGPYVLTRLGQIQDVYYHYQVYHWRELQPIHIKPIEEIKKALQTQEPQPHAGNIWLNPPKE